MFETDFVQQEFVVSGLLVRRKDDSRFTRQWRQLLAIITRHMNSGLHDVSVTQYVDDKKDERVDVVITRRKDEKQ